MRAKAVISREVNKPVVVEQIEVAPPRAGEVMVTGAGDDGSRESAYERVGEALIDHCDMLIAVWDGTAARGRGGTADVVQAARARGRNVIVIDGARQE